MTEYTLFYIPMQNLRKSEACSHNWADSQKNVRKKLNFNNYIYLFINYNLLFCETVQL